MKNIVIHKKIYHMKSINKIIKIFFIVDFGVVIFCLLSGEKLWMLNTQIAFFSSLFIIIGSYIGYKNNIQKQLDEQNYTQDNTPDTIDKIDDQFDLYSSEINEEIIENPTKQQIKEAMKPIKQNHIKNLKQSFSAIGSIYRIVGYIGLVIGFFYLRNNHFLDIYSYFFGFMIVPISALISKFICSDLHNF